MWKKIMSPTEKLEESQIEQALIYDHEYPIVERTEVAQLGKTAVEGLDG
jgi:hypothetical protein